MTFDLLIIGSGIGGMSAALRALEEGLTVCLLSKEADPLESNTRYAQGGIVYKGGDDNPGLLEKDITEAGCGINYVEAVRLLSRTGADLVEKYLVKGAGVPFCRNGEGEFDLTKEGAHSLRRILHVKDYTGKAIVETMAGALKKHRNLTWHTGCCAVDLITNSHNSTDSQQRYRETRVLGAYVFDSAKSKVKAVFARGVFLATGGVGNLFQHTSNPSGATGDGVAMAYRCGASIINSEFIQFHPTVLYHRDIKRFLLTEALRGEGAKLCNRHGEYFMERYNRRLKDLAPRDEVSRAIYREMEKENSSYVYLDATCIKGLDIRSRFPSIYETLKEGGIDMTAEPVPVVPAAHYYCGGVKVDLNSRTSLKGLWALGETACTGVHGANRLASVSLLEALTFGVQAAEDFLRHPPAADPALVNTIRPWQMPDDLEEFDPLLIQNDLNSIQNIMWNYAGIVRTVKRLERAANDLNYLKHRVERFYRKAAVSREIIELRNSVVTATVIVQSALANRKSIGCHYLARG